MNFRLFSNTTYYDISKRLTHKKLLLALFSVLISTFIAVVALAEAECPAGKVESSELQFRELGIKEGVASKEIRGEFTWALPCSEIRILVKRFTPSQLLAAASGQSRILRSGSSRSPPK